MKKLFLYVPALILLAVSCEKEENLPAYEENAPVSKVEMITETVSGGRAATKVIISDQDASFAWTDGDDVAVHISNGKYVYTSDEGAHGATITDVIHSENAVFTVVYEAGYSRDAFAVYPSTLVAKDAENYGQEGHTLDVTLPGSYTLAQVSGETSPCPMISTDVAGSGWDFYQLCGLMRLTVNSIPATAKRLEIDFNGKKVWGNFSIASPVVPGTSAIVAGDDDAYDVIKITKDGTDVELGETSLMLNIPLPAGEYANVTITAYDALVDGNAILSITRPFNRESTNERAFKRTASFPSSKTAFRGYEVSAGILQRSVVGTDVTYTLTAGGMDMTYDPTTGKEVYALPEGYNPFEPIYYFNNSSLNQYFLTWNQLKSDLGADGDNIDADSDKLPGHNEGWIMPTSGSNSGSDWGKILFGTPRSTITIGGTPTTRAFANVRVILEEGHSYGKLKPGSYDGLLLLRDGSDIPSGYFTDVNSGKYNGNPLSEQKFKELIHHYGCLFISLSGYYWSSWRDTTQGFYWGANKYSSKGRCLGVSTDGGCRVEFNGHNPSSYYHLVKLVKPVAN